MLEIMGKKYLQLLMILNEMYWHMWFILWNDLQHKLHTKGQDFG